MARADAPVTKERFVHVTDPDRVPAIRKTGIRPSTGAGAMGDEGVYAVRSADFERVPKGRVAIEFEADPNRVGGRGTSFMGRGPESKTRLLRGGRIDPEAIVGGYDDTGTRMFDLGSRTMGALGMVDSLAALADAVSGGRINAALERNAPSLAWLMQGGLLGDVFNATAQNGPWAARGRELAALERKYPGQVTPEGTVLG
jgi:hypothetical protein